MFYNIIWMALSLRSLVALKWRLCNPFSSDEIKAAVWSCGNGKSSGPDKLNAEFF